MYATAQTSSDKKLAYTWITNNLWVACNYFYKLLKLYAQQISHWSITRLFALLAVGLNLVAFYDSCFPGQEYRLDEINLQQYNKEKIDLRPSAGSWTAPQIQYKYWRPQLSGKLLNWLKFYFHFTLPIMQCIATPFISAQFRWTYIHHTEQIAWRSNDMKKINVSNNFWYRILFASVNQPTNKYNRKLSHYYSPIISVQLEMNFKPWKYESKYNPVQLPLFKW